MSAETDLTKKLFTVQEFERICDAGIFSPDSRFELIRGEIVEMPKPSRRHAGRVNKLNRVFTDGAYSRTEFYERGQTLTPQKLPDTVFTIDELIS
jgi:Uma2 family endonuclease